MCSLKRWPTIDRRAPAFPPVLRILVLAVWLSMAPLYSSESAARAVDSPDAGTSPAGQLQVFVREGCPHCAEAKVFLAEFAARYPRLRIVYRPVDSDAAARDELLRTSEAAGVWPPGVPTFVYEGRVLVGFDDAAGTGPALVGLIEASADSTAEIDAGLRGALGPDRLGLPLFSLALGLLDGFNPCAMWVLLFLLSLLVHLRDRRRMALIAGTFVLASGAVYYAFMAAWLNVFLAVGMSAGLRVVLGLLALIIGGVNLHDSLQRERRFMLSIPEAAKPGLYARMRVLLEPRGVVPSLLAVAGLAVVVNFVELLCTAGLPALYTAVLAQQDLGTGAYYGYLGLYILGYLADDSIMVGAAVIALSNRRLTERGGRWLKLVSGAVMLVLGAVIILRPDWLM
jgi:glutaredoxin